MYFDSRTKKVVIDIKFTSHRLKLITDGTTCCVYIL